MKNVKKIFTLIMVLAMALTLAVPVMAADTFDIVINHPNELTDHEYEAYVIFSGELHTDASGKEILSNIQWGSGVDGAAVITALKAASTLFADANTAQQVADVISTHNTDVALVNTFRHILGDNLIASAAKAPNTAVDGVYTWDNVTAGYYLIKDKDGSLDDTEETATNYILQVVGDTTVNPKGGKVTHNKLIEDGGNRVEAADYSVGDDVKFILRGTLPSNFADFETYTYQFVDTLSAGLTFNNDVKVYLENAGSKDELATGFVVNTAPSVAGATFTVDFADLKAITDRTIDQHTTIVVEYTAKLNEAAVIGAPGNPNESYIIFDNNPHTDGEGQTPPDEVFAFTWELDVFKVNGDNDKLANAEFILYRNLSGSHQYAVVDGNGKLTGWVAAEADASKLVSDQNGKFIVQGLESDVYYLQETKAPDGYHLLEAPITVDITASVGENETGTAGVVTNLQIKVDNHSSRDGDTATGIVSMNVVNNPGATLPETGGVGTTLFYVFGGLMVAVAAVLLITKKRMDCEN